MNVRQLINELRKLPRWAEVRVVWDGALRTDVNVAYLSRGDRENPPCVVLGDYEDLVYDDHARPAWAPSEDDEGHWELPTPEAWPK